MNKERLLYVLSIMTGYLFMDEELLQQLASEEYGEPLTQERLHNQMIHRALYEKIPETEKMEVVMVARTTLGQFYFPKPQISS